MAGERRGEGRRSAARRNLTAALSEGRGLEWIDVRVARKPARPVMSHPARPRLTASHGSYPHAPQPKWRLGTRHGIKLNARGIVGLKMAPAMTFQELMANIDRGIFAWRRLYQPWIVAHLVLSNGRTTIDDLCTAYPPGLSLGDSDETTLKPEDRVRSAVRTLEKNGIAAYDGEGGILLNSVLTPAQKLLVIDKCLSKSLDGKSLRDCLA